MKLTSARMYVVLFTLLMTTVAIESSAAQDLRNFWFLNNTGKTIERIYVSPHESFNWGDDVLGSANLPDGLGTIIRFNPRSRSSCYFDFRLIFRDRTMQTYVNGWNLCAVHAVQFNDGKSEVF